MKAHKFLYLLILNIILINCHYGEQKYHKYIEKQYEFSSLRHGYDPSNNWIRQSSNLVMLHETFKCIGYKNIISADQWLEPSLYLNNSRPLCQLVDSLIYTYGKESNTNDYFMKFWKRRQNEGIDKVVYCILNEVKIIMQDETPIECQQDLANDTLIALLELEQPTLVTPSIGIDNIKYLIEVGMHQSAYNILSGEYYNNNSVSQAEKETLLQQLDATDTYIYPWFEDNTK